MKDTLNRQEGVGEVMAKPKKLKWSGKACPTCGNTHVMFHIVEDGIEMIEWHCGHQRGMGRPV